MTKFIVRGSHEKSKKKNKGTPILGNNGGVIGHVTGEEFYRQVTRIMFRPDAIATDTAALTNAERAGALVCVVRHKTKGVTYRVDLAAIRAHGFLVDFGAGPQLALELSYWTQEQDPQPLNYTSRAQKGVTFTKGVKQLGFWGRRK